MTVLVGSGSQIPIILAPSRPPQLAVVIDAEVQFDWKLPFSRDCTRVSHMRHIGLAQKVCETHGVVPTYVVDYAIASQPMGYSPLKDFADDGRADIGAHLHPWISPPFHEPVDSYHSYAGNLPAELEREKLKVLRDRIWEAFDRPPRIYRAGRYGLGPNSFRIVSDLGFEIDTSPSPGFDLSGDGGPDYSQFSVQPFWLEAAGKLLCIPCTGALVGPFYTSWKASLDRSLRGKPVIGSALGLLSRTKLLTRMRLTPEGYSLADMRQLTKFLIGHGTRLFVLSFHSPTIEPGCTPYARTSADRDQFLNRLHEYFDYFFGELGGNPTTLLQFRQFLLTQK